ncbi:MAG TPA: hypothetical protein VFG68_18820 [Fimbriiglobus sp.]|nr:hypothetical protein [Fimbriiglobus sp.]
MTTRQRRYPIEELARRGTELYEQTIRPQVEAGNRGRIVTIDIETGEYEVADDALKAELRMIDRKPNVQLWTVRIGYPAVVRFGYMRVPGTV